MPMQVLILSHIGVLRRSLQLVLQRAGHAALTADTLEGAFQLLSRKSDVDVVISEWSLGNGSVCDLYLRLQQIPRLADVAAASQLPAFILLSTPLLQLELGGRTSVAVQMRSFGFRDILEKPVNREKLLARLKDIEAERRRPRAAAKDAPAGAVDSSPPRPAELPPPVAVPPPGPSRRPDEQLQNLQTEIRELQAKIDAQQQRLRQLSHEVQTLGGQADGAP